MSEPPTPSGDRPPLSRRRRIVAFVGALLMALGAAIGIFLVGAAILGGAGDKSPALVFAGVVFGAGPAFVGFLIWWPAVNWGR